MAVCAVALLGVSVWWAGVRAHVAFLPILRQMGCGRSTWSEFGQAFYRDPHNQSFNSLFHHLFVASGATQPWINLGPSWANGLTWAAFFGCVVLVVWRTLSLRRQWIGRVHQADHCGGCDLRMVYSLFLLLSLLGPSLYWDHYAVVALWPLLACWARLQEKVRAPAYAAMVLAALVLGTFLEPHVYRTAVLLLALVVAFAALIACRRAGGLRGVVWAVAAGMLLSRFLFDLPIFTHGAGLLAMSMKLWGTLLLFGLCLVFVDRGKGAVASRGVDEA